MSIHRRRFITGAASAGAGLILPRRARADSGHSLGATRTFLGGPQPKNAYSYYSSGSYNIYTNTPAPSRLVNNVDYTSRIYYDTARFPNDIEIAQVWPSTQPGYVWGYPCIEYVLPSPTQIRNINSLVINYNITISGSNATNGGTTPQNFDIAIDLFTVSGFEIFLGIYIPRSWGGTNNVGWSLDLVSPLNGTRTVLKPGVGIFCNCAADSLTALNGPIDLKQVFTILVANGVIADTEVIQWVDLGMELKINTGNAKIMNFSGALT